MALGARDVAELASVPKAPRPDIQPPSIEHLGALVAAISGGSPDLGSLTLFAFPHRLLVGRAVRAALWEDVDWDTHSLRVARSVWELGGKTGLKTTKSDWWEHSLGRTRFDAAANPLGPSDGPGYACPHPPADGSK